MADNEGVRTTGNAWVVSLTPDVCLTPIGDKMVPIPYNIRASFDDSVSQAVTVQMTTLSTVTMASRVTRVEGDEQGTGGGITSGVNLGYCRPITHSSTVRGEGNFIVYHTSLYWMNCAGPDGPGNTVGHVVFLPDGMAPYAGPLVDLDALKAQAEAEEKKSWWDSASGWVHGALDIAGLIPGFGEIADGLNAGIYLAEGDYLNAGLSAAAMIPFAGWAATGGKLANKVGKAVLKEVAEEAVEKVAKEGVEKLAKEGVEKLEKEAVKKLEKEAAEKLEKEAAEKLEKEAAEEGAEQGTKKATDGVEVQGGGKKGGDGGSNPKDGDAGSSSGSSKNEGTSEGHPVDVATGEVVDDATDVTLPGLIPLVFERRYASSRRSDRSSALGPGWAHSYDQWIEEGDHAIKLRDGEGRWIHFAKVDPGQETFHRRERLTLKREADGSYHIHSPADRLTRSYEGAGRAHLRSIRDAHGNAIKLDYSADRLVRIVDTAGREIKLSWDRSRLARLDVHVQGRVEQSVEYRYSRARNLSSVVDALGNTREYEYDGADRMIAARLENGVRFEYAYDGETDRCVRTWGPDGLHEVRFFPDQAARTTMTVSEEPKVYTWNDAGVVTREATTDGITLSERAYDDDNLLLEQRDGAGHTTRYARDARGNLTSVVDAAGNKTAWEYSGDLPIRRIGPDGLSTEYSYDERGETVGITTPTGARYSLAYDALGRLTAVDGPLGPVWRYEHDASHNVIAEVDARGARTTYDYDAAGRPVARTDALGRVTRIAYDRLGRPVSVEHPDGTVTRSEYDARGNMTRFVDAMGQATTMEYSGTGVLARLTLPDQRTWSFAYTTRERLQQITNPRGERYSFVYDNAGRITEERPFDGRTLKYRYSAAGKVDRIEYPDGTSRAFTHDKLGNLVLERSTDGMLTFPRDPLGRLIAAVAEEGEHKVVTMFERDAFGRIVTERQGDRALRFEYDALGRRTRRVLPNGATTLYFHDALDALIGVEHDGHRMTLERDLLGREVWRGTGGGHVSIQSGYDAMDRLIEQRVGGASSGAEVARNLVARKWSYDSLGRLTQVDDGRWGTTTYRYDRVNQLLEARRESYREVFEYDAAGSLSKMLKGLEGQAASSTWDIDAGNLLQRTENAKYTYDRRGRRVVKLELAGRGEPGNGAVTEYTWDCRDRLREVRLPDGGRVRFSYDAFGRRVRKEVVPAGAESAERRTDFVWDRDELAADLDGTRGARVFVHEPGTFVPLLQAEQGHVFAVVHDHLGMPKELVGPDGRVVWSASHSAWGQVLETWREPGAKYGQPVESPFRLLGQYADEETGLCYTRFRYFDPEVGRWCSPDPLGIAGGYDLIGFNGSPTQAIDPFGLTAGIYWFHDLENDNKLYVGQSNNIERRLDEHRRDGRLDSPGSAKTQEVAGDKFDREIAEQNKINEITDGKGIDPDKVSNKRNPVGEKRQAEATKRGSKNLPPKAAAHETEASAGADILCSANEPSKCGIVRVR